MMQVDNKSINSLTELLDLGSETKGKILATYRIIEEMQNRYILVPLWIADILREYNSTMDQVNAILQEINKK